MTVRALPILIFHGKRWFLDERLSEVRDVNQPSRSISLSRDLVAALKIFGEFERPAPDGARNRKYQGGADDVPERC